MHKSDLSRLCHKSHFVADRTVCHGLLNALKVRQISLVETDHEDAAGGVRRCGHPPCAQDAIVTALGRAFHWQEMLDSGRVKSSAALARQLHMEKSNVARILRLTALAPDIVDALLEGVEPDGLSLTRLFGVKSRLWSEQREELGFAAK
jgi:hypothetical protein